LVSPSTSLRKMKKGLFETDADEIVLDLEDSVPDPHKEIARKNIVEVLESYEKSNWKTISVRINSLESDLWYEDLSYLIRRVGSKIDCIVIPKVESPADVQLVDKVLKELEDESGSNSPIGIEALIETAKGILYCGEIAFSSPRLEALIFGPTDYAASIGMMSMSSGMAENKNLDRIIGYIWLYPLFVIRNTSAAAGLQAIDGPYLLYKDLDGLVYYAKLSKSIGFDGKWVIHPNQVEICNRIYTPSNEEVEWARKVVMIYERGVSEGVGVLSLGDLMVDRATVRIAQRILETDQTLAGIPRRSSRSDPVQ
jgi:citrate lyase beta subunit